QGTIDVVLRDGSVSAYASDLLNFDPLANDASSTEGLRGAAVDPTTGDLYVTLTYSSDPNTPTAPHFAAVERFTSNDGGHTAATRTRIRSLDPEPESTRHFISDVSFGPDDLLYVYVGDAGDPTLSQNLQSYHGKVLRMTRDGAPASRNPYYNVDDGISPRDFIFSTGIGDPEGAAWRLAEGNQYFVDSGSQVDRLARASVGHDFGWDGTDVSLFQSSLYNWVPSVAPKQIAFLESALFSRSGFPSEYEGRAYVTQSAGDGMGDGTHKAITEWNIAAGGELREGPRPIAYYEGSGDSTPVALAAGPDGLYFSDFSSDDPSDPNQPGASVLRLSFQGASTPLDCNQNGVADTSDLSLGTSLDCNLGGAPDECDIAAGRSKDCNGNGKPDECEAEVASAVDLSPDTSTIGFLGGATLTGTALELRPAPGAPASVISPPLGSLPLQYFRIRFDVQVDASGSDGVALALFDLNEPTDGASFGIAGPGPGAILVAVDTTSPESGAAGSLLVSYDGQVLGHYTPSFALLDGEPHTLDVLFDGHYLNINVGSAGGTFEAAFQALEVPKYAPFVARYGFGTSTPDALVTYSIRNVQLWRPTAADTNANGRLDGCECVADIDDGNGTGEPDGHVTDDDLRYFLTLFDAGLLSADLDDGSGEGIPDGVLSIEDIRYFLQHFHAGC
ncbi:MAG TPA: PQQ-dependent sugar dehydrogenase, partial [Polyangiaceae bacterium]|nr:PQQ-dependent sugar dehydrogenase [Polyangiaceae bacterium]